MEYRPIVTIKKNNKLPQQVGASTSDRFKVTAGLVWCKRCNKWHMRAQIKPVGILTGLLPSIQFPGDFDEHVVDNLW